MFYHTEIKFIIHKTEMFYQAFWEGSSLADSRGLAA